MNTTLLSDYVDRSADRFPQNVAYRCVKDAISYEQLGIRTTQLANFLIEEGVQSEDRVGVFLPRSLESAVAVHGILKSGAAFVPIDPATPLDRLRSIVRDCGIKHLITDGSKRLVLNELFTERNAHLSPTCVLGLTLDSTSTARCFDWEILDDFPSTRPTQQISESHLAYVMYTSGSTGLPKGIMHTHSSGGAYAELSRDLYDIGPTDVIGNHSPLHFDMSTLGYLTAPLAAAETSIIPAAYTKMPASLSQLMEDHEMTVWYSVPYALIQLLLRGACEQRDHSSLRWILFGGEPFPSKHLQSSLRCWDSARFSNVYGPAEVNQCTFFNVPDTWKHLDVLPPLPIGTVWGRTESLVVSTEDNCGSPPANLLDESVEEGELLIASPTMMKGYWRRPDLNKQAFYEENISTEKPQKTYYRTGDLVCTQSDGNLLFLGRIDRQTKLRGHRIELDEIEAAIVSHPAVEECGAFPITRNGEVVEIGSSVLRSRTSNSAPSVAMIKEFAASKLPAYAVPTWINLVDVLPRTTSGKIDRRSLQDEAEKRNSVGSAGPKHED